LLAFLHNHPEDLAERLTEAGIDKRSCAELTEAINSMYKWYQNAQKCYVYLYDVPKKPWEDSDWFTRGWTLQELIAPSHLVFYDSNWTRLGTKEDLKSDISRLTGIPESVLLGLTPMLVPVADKMSWASRRRTTRTEDMAYCLMGIFDVNMPLLYGEGPKAFKRLQEEIIRQNNTHTIFAWRKTDFPHVYYGALAPSLACFDLPGTRFIFNSTERPPSVSSCGVHVEVYLRRQEPHEDLYEAILQRQRVSDGLSPSILVLHIPGGPRESGKDRKIFTGDNFVRVDASNINYIDLKDWPSDLRNKSKMEIVLNNVSTTPPLVSKPELTQEIYILKAEPQEILGEKEEVYPFSSRNYLAKRKSGKIIGLLYNIHPRWFIVAVGLGAFGAPWCQILIPNLLDQVSQAQEVYRAFSLESHAPLLATHKLEGIHAAVWLSHSISWPILCVSVEMSSVLEIVQAV
jgi:hypothetical protein